MVFIPWFCITKPDARQTTEIAKLDQITGHMGYTISQWGSKLQTPFVLSFIIVLDYMKTKTRQQISGALVHVVKGLTVKTNRIALFDKAQFFIPRVWWR